MSGLGVQIGVFFLCLLVSAFLSGFEAGVFALDRLRLRGMARSGGGNPAARKLLTFLEKPENFLWTILVGNVLANLLAIGLLLAHLRLWVGGEPWLFWPLFLVSGFFVYIFGELLPKALYRRFPIRLSMRSVTPFRIIHLALSPVVSFVEGFARQLLRWTGGEAYSGRLFANRDELRQLLLESGGNLSATERTLINRVLDLQNQTVGHLAKPLETAVAVDEHASRELLLDLYRERAVTRVPVWQGTGPHRKILGIVDLNDVLYSSPSEGKETRTASDFLRPALFLEDTVVLEEALRRLQRSGQQFAIVLGSDRRERGLITLWDVLRSVFGGAAT